VNGLASPSSPTGARRPIVSYLTKPRVSGEHEVRKPGFPWDRSYGSLTHIGVRLRRLIRHHSRDCVVDAAKVQRRQLGSRCRSVLMRDGGRLTVYGTAGCRLRSQLAGGRCLKSHRWGAGRVCSLHEDAGPDVCDRRHGSRLGWPTRVQSGVDKSPSKARVGTDGGGS